jgi:hypothetical protein
MENFYSNQGEKHSRSDLTSLIQCIEESVLSGLRRVFSTMSWMKIAVFSY